MSSRQNILGGRLQTLRVERELTQEQLAARCAVLGWDASSNTVAKIETGVRCLTDRELILITRALRVKIQDVFVDFPKLL
ncbi:MAG: helix-turn-helix transcriptional regulator [Verrucomicrobiales bacterium]|jgi:transcriptional regulator with XRE-family HTH domain|nr:helix-turn-helix transcriptional regulator [Verrucomicrobiales bacterium]